MTTDRDNIWRGPGDPDVAWRLREWLAGKDIELISGNDAEMISGLLGRKDLEVLKLFFRRWSAASVEEQDALRVLARLTPFIPDRNKLIVSYARGVLFSELEERNG